MSVLAPSPAPPGAVQIVAEEAAPHYPLWLHPGWQERHPWLVQGTTGRGDQSLDLGWFGEVPARIAQERWRALRQATGMPTAVHARQVHEARVLWHRDLPAGLFIGDDADGHATATAGLLLTISVADCVPIFLLDPSARAIALLHGGWRGVAAGILEAGIAMLADQHGTQVQDLELHCGPSICGRCYEVGSEVPAALALPGTEAGHVLLDLRAVIAQRALRAGLSSDHVTLSAHCTRCDDSAFWSHRAGARQRQLGVLGIRAG